MKQRSSESKSRRGGWLRAVLIAASVACSGLVAALTAPAPAHAQFRVEGGFGRNDGGYGRGDGGFEGGYRRDGYDYGRDRFRCVFGGCGGSRWGRGREDDWPRSVYYPPRRPIYHPPRRPIRYPPRIYYPPDGGEIVYHRPPRRIRQAAPVIPPPPVSTPIARKPTRVAAPVAPPPASPPVAAKRQVPPGHFVIPPPGETRYVPDEVLVEIPARLTASGLQAIERRLGLTLIASGDLSLTSTRVNRYRIAKGRTVAATVRTLRDEARVAGAQPNYVFALQQGAPSSAAPLEATPAVVAADSGYSLQYTIAALHLIEAHRLATGKGVRIAIIDSGIDADSAEIKGRIVARLDTVGGEFQAHAHGTAIAGAILAHAKLVGVAPDAEVVAIRAFTGEGKPSGAEGTSFHILQGLDFAAAQKARIVNMSFAGPHDAMLARALDALRTRGVTEVAAAGNGGARSPPLYPGAEPGVIAVTATDAKGKLFIMANRGAYIAMAAPGVDILLPAPGNSVQIASGTSIAAAHVSGIAALLLEKYGMMAPDALILGLDAGARKPDPMAAAPGAADYSAADYGAGVIDAYGALRGKPGEANLQGSAPVASAIRR